MKDHIYNPNNVPERELPVIYGFNNGGSPGFLLAELISEDGVFLGSHVCSHECYMPGDLGIIEGSRPDRHEHFRKHYPAGYRMEFVGSAYVYEHKGLMEAVRLNNEAQQYDH